ncbi:MAG: shikimate dehydrogenase [Bacteroidota bacterium]
MKIDARTRLVTLLGYSLGHSLSPEIHNTAFQLQQINMAYLCMEVHPDQLKQALDGFRAARFVGSNVTIPHKQAIHKLVDTLSEQARAVGAVNTIVSQFDENGEIESLHGDNTDVRGFLEPLAPYAGKLEGGEMVVFGAGGAARAVAYGILQAYQPAQLTIVARNTGKAEQLAKDLAAYDNQRALQVVSFSEATNAVRNGRLLVNATPVGMHHDADQTPWPEAKDFSRHQVVYDLVYNPEKTRLLNDAAQQGAQTLGGLEMLIQQAAASYQQWTHKSMPLDAVRHAVRTKLGL